MDLIRQAPTKACHNCRRRRLRCDRSVPSCHKCTSAGQECLGYGKLFKWADGAASRGKLAGTLKQPPGSGRPSSSRAVRDDRSSASSVSSRASTPAGPSSEMQMQLVHAGIAHLDPAQFELSTPWVLVDPVFQDIDAPYRYYLSYFTNRLCKDLVSWDLPDNNPFRTLVPLTKASPLLQHVIVAASAAHMSNLQRPPLAPSASNAGTLVYPGSVEASRRTLIDALAAKQKALRLLYRAVQDIDAVGSEVVLASVLFLINVELLESGKHGWKAHLEGAGRILACIQPTEGPNAALRDYIVSDCVIYYILASAFMPNAPAGGSAVQSPQASSMVRRAAANSYLCCPPEVLETLLAAGRLSNVKTTDEASADALADAGLQLFRQAQNLDITEWALSIRAQPNLHDVPIDSRIHAGSAHRVAGALYILQAVPCLRSMLPPDTRKDLEDQLFHHLACVPDEDPNFKATTWPGFIAGAEASNPERQEWVKHRLQRTVRLVPWGFIYTALDTLDIIWGLQKEGKTQEGWVQTLKDPDMNFLIV